MRNKYLAKVLVANKFVPESVVKEFWPKVTPGQDIGQVLVAAKKIDEKTYQRVLAYVKQLEAKNAAKAQAEKPAEKPATKPAAKQEPATFGRSNALAAPATSSIIEKTPEPPVYSGGDGGIQIEGNNLYGKMTTGSVQIEQVSGLETSNAAGFQVSKEGSDEAEAEGALPARFILNSGEGDQAVPDLLKISATIREVLAYARACQVSDIYLVEGKPIAFRRFGALAFMTEEKVPAAKLNEWLLDISKGFADAHAPAIGKNFSKTFSLSGVGRARLTVTWTGVTPALAIRLIASEPVPFANLYLPEFAADFAGVEHGLVLIAGPSFSGRTTTLYAFAEAISATRYCSIQSVENPIERLLENPNGSIVQREVGLHVKSGEEGIQLAVEEGADVLLYDSVSNSAELSVLMDAAHSGMAVFATAFGNNIFSVLNRYYDEVPPDSKEGFASSLASLLKGVIVQHLVPLANGEGMVLASEVMKVNSSVANLLRKGDFSQIQAALLSMQGSAISLDDTLQMLVDSGYIQGSEAFIRAFDVKRFSSFLSGR